MPFELSPLLIAGMLACLTVGCVVLLILESRKKRQLHQRIGRIQQVGRGNERAETVAGIRREVGDPKLAFIAAIMPNLTPMRSRLERAGLTISAEMYVLINLVLIVLITVLMALFTKQPLLLGIMLGTIVGVSLPHFFVGFKVKKRQKRFIALFPDAIDLIVRGLRAGLPVAESVNVVAHEIEEPIAGTFRQIGQTVKLGVTLEKSLHDMALRLKMTEFDFFVTSITLQRETGGNLAEILNNLSDTIRKRHMMRLKIKAMASEGNASAAIVGSLPLIMLVVLHFMRPDLTDILINDYRGNIAAIAGFAFLGAGVGSMLKLTRFEI